MTLQLLDEKEESLAVRCRRIPILRGFLLWFLPCLNSLTNQRIEFLTTVERIGGINSEVLFDVINPHRTVGSFTGNYGDFDTLLL